MTHASSRSFGKVITRLVAVTVAILTLAGVGAQSAGAVTQYHGWQGNPGWLTYSGYFSADPTYAGMRPYITGNAAQVHRSPATSDAQTVYYVYTKWDWHPEAGWTNPTSTPLLSVVIPAGYDLVSLDGPHWGGSTRWDAVPGYHMFSLAAVFMSGDTVLGSFKVNYDEARDYGCRRSWTDQGQCVVNDGFVYVS